jgi:uncharacterized protein (TIGR03067 family)
MYALLLLGSCLVIAMDDSILKDKDRLEDMWGLVSAAEDGNKPRPGGNTSLILKDGKFIIYISPKAGHVDNPGTGIESSYTTDPAKTPATMDITPLNGPNKGKTSLAIYVIEGDHLKICRTTLPGTERPREFVSKRGTLLQVFQKR